MGRAETPDSIPFQSPLPLKSRPGNQGSLLGKPSQRAQPTLRTPALSSTHVSQRVCQCSPLVRLGAGLPEPETTSVLSRCDQPLNERTGPPFHHVQATDTRNHAMLAVWPVTRAHRTCWQSGRQSGQGIWRLHLLTMTLSCKKDACTLCKMLPVTPRCSVALDKTPAVFKWLSLRPPEH